MVPGADEAWGVNIESPGNRDAALAPFAPTLGYGAMPTAMAGGALPDVRGAAAAAPAPATAAAASAAVAVIAAAS